jgi:hypothetical protein
MQNPTEIENKKFTRYSYFSSSVFPLHAETIDWKSLSKLKIVDKLESLNFITLEQLNLTLLELKI